MDSSHETFDEAIACNPEASEALQNLVSYQSIVEANQNLEKSITNLKQIFEDLETNPAALDCLIEEPIIDALLDRQLEKMWQQEKQDYFNTGLKNKSTKKLTEVKKETDVLIPVGISQSKVCIDRVRLKHPYKNFK